MTHYDCRYCGAGVYEECSPDCEPPSPINVVSNRQENPPLGLRPKAIAGAERVEEIQEAIMRYVRAGKTIPTDWIIELREFDK